MTSRDVRMLAWAKGHRWKDTIDAIDHTRGREVGKYKQMQRECGNISGQMPRKATFADGFAVASDGCRLSYHLSGNPEAEDKVCVI